MCETMSCLVSCIQCSAVSFFNSLLSIQARCQEQHLGPGMYACEDDRGIVRVCMGTDLRHVHT